MVYTDFIPTPAVEIRDILLNPDRSTILACGIASFTTFLFKSTLPDIPAFRRPRVPSRWMMTGGMPSGHVSLATAWSFMSLDTPFALAYQCLVAFLRVHTNAHTWLQCFMGWIVGGLSVYAVSILREYFY